MEFWNILSGSRLVEALGLTLMHSLWQGAAVAILLSLGLLGLRKHSAAIRYWAVLGAMALMLLGGAITFGLCLEEARPSAQTLSERPAMGYAWANAPVNVAENSTHWFAQLPEYFKNHAPLLVASWLMGMCMLSLKMLGGYLLAQRMRTYRTKSVPERWQSKLNQLANTIGISKQVMLLESGMAKSPLTLGHFKPLVLMPLGLLVGLPVEQVEAILAHELAHIKRNDYLVNLVHSLVEIVFFYHPAIWWMGTLLHEERENACDDLAIAAIGNRVAFAKALATIETGQFSMPRVAMGMAGRKGQLLGRIQRILGMSKNNKPLPEKMVIASLLMLALFSTGFGKKEEIKEAMSEATAIDWKMSLFSETDTSRKEKRAKKQEKQDRESRKEEVREEREVYIINSDGKAPFIWHTGDSSKSWSFVMPAIAPFNHANMQFSGDSIHSFIRIHSDSLIENGMQWAMPHIAPNIWINGHPKIKIKSGKKGGIYSYEFDFEGMPNIAWLDSTHKFEFPDSLSEEEREAFEERMEAMHERLADLHERQQELAEERMEIVKEQQIVIQERMEIAKEHQQERMKEVEIRYKDDAARAQARAEEALARSKESQIRAEAMQKENAAKWAQLKEDLVADGLLPNKEAALKCYLDKEELRVNGQQASAELHQKYLKRYETQFKGQIIVISEDGFRIVIDMK